MGKPGGEEYFQTLFEHAPISLWEEDFSGIKSLFDALREEGVQSLESYLDEKPDFVETCMQSMVVKNVNQQTLDMLKAASQDELLANLDQVFRDGMRHHFRDELLTLWNGDLVWSGEGVNYALDGKMIDILLHWRILPGCENSWERVLVTIENISARKQAEKRLQDLFEASPVSLWEEDYSAVKAYFDTLRAEGVTSLQRYLKDHPEAVSHCMGLIRVLDVNQRTLDQFGANSKAELLGNLDKVFRDEMETHFAKELVDLWNGKLAYDRDGINYNLEGNPVNIHLDFRVMPGHEGDYSWVLVAIQDITARKKAEEYLRYLGTHDVLTGVYNRAYFQEALLKMGKEKHDPVSIIMADLNGLKHTNDTLGHQAGDNLIRRAAEVLKTNFEESGIVARIGGDEFAILLPEADAQKADEDLQGMHNLIDLNNKYYREPDLSISFGAATSRPGLALEKVVVQADNAMYRTKGEYYQRRKEDR
jgi:diguanylate cyclase (GGDEF)-like protein